MLFFGMVHGISDFVIVPVFSPILFKLLRLINIPILSSIFFVCLVIRVRLSSPPLLSSLLTFSLPPFLPISFSLSFLVFLAASHVEPRRLAYPQAISCLRPLSSSTLIVDQDFEYDIVRSRDRDASVICRVHDHVPPRSPS